MQFHDLGIFFFHLYSYLIIFTLYPPPNNFQLLILFFPPTGLICLFAYLLFQTIHVFSPVGLAVLISR